MKNKGTQVNLTQLAANGNALDLAIAEAQGKVTVKKLRTRGPRKGETLSKAQGGGHAVGSVRGTDSNSSGTSAGTSGARMTLTAQCGQGREMVANLDRVVSTYKRVKAAEHRADARAEAAARRAEREANAFADLDTLLDEVRG